MKLLLASVDCFQLVVLLLAVNLSECCLPTNDRKAFIISPETSKEVGKYLRTFSSEASFKNFVNISKYSNDSFHNFSPTVDYNSHKRPLPNGEELFSDFDAPHCCCWGTENKSSSDGGKSGLEWRVAKITSQTLLQSGIVNSSLPRGKFLFATPSRPVSLKDRTTFVSCEIKCTDQATLAIAGCCGANLQNEQSFRQVGTMPIGTQPVSSGSDNFRNIRWAAFQKNDLCSKIPRDFLLQTFPTLDQGTMLAIEASNFTEGSFAAIDEISASAKPCQKKETDTLFSATNYDACRRVTCDFEGGICSYQTLPVDEQLTSMILTSGQIGNKVNGVPGPANGKTFVGALLKPSQRFFISTTNLNLDEDAVLRFDVLERTDGVQVAVCFDGNECPYASNLALKASDNNWNEISVPVPAKTKTISFLASNEAKNTGAIGLDNVRLLIPKGKFPEDATDAYC